MALSDREILAIVDSEFESAMGSPGGEISLERAKNFDYFLSKPLGNEVDGQSQVVTSDVSDVIGGIMPSLLRLFTTKENLVQFDPVGPEDEEQAAQESDYTNYIFFKQNPAFDIMYGWFFDALVQKNGIVKAWWDESEVITTEPYEGLDEVQLMELLADEELEPVERDEREENGVTLYDVTFKRTCKKGRVRIENVPPDEYRISSDARWLDPGKARMVGQEREVPRSDLIAMGFNKDTVMGLPSSGSNYGDTEEKISRYNKVDEQWGGFPDPSQEMVEVREAYIKLDMKGNGKSELRQVITAGGKLLSNEPADRQPFHVICPQPLPHKHFGRCPADQIKDIQDVNSTLLRQTLDNLYHSNNPGHILYEGAIGENTLDDFLTTRIGSIKRVDRPVAEAWAPQIVPFTAQASFGMLEYWDKVKRDRTGVSSDAEGLSPEQLKNIQSSVMAQANDLSRMKIEAIARIFAETGIKSLFLHIHELVLKHQDREQVVKLRNQWVQVDPTSWRTRFDMTVNIGLGVGTREQNLLFLNDIWEKQRQMIEGGGLNITVAPENIYNTVAEIVKNGNYKNAEMFFQNPATIDMEALQQQEGPDPQMAAIEAQVQIETAKIQQRTDEAMLKHQEKMAELEQRAQEANDKIAVMMEQVMNTLTEYELKYKQDVPGSRV